MQVGVRSGNMGIGGNMGHTNLTYFCDNLM